MKKISTLFLGSFLTLAAMNAEAQVPPQNFNSNPVTPNGCFLASGFAYNSTAKNEATKGGGYLATQYIDITGGATISAAYNIENKSNRGGTVQIGIVNQSGTFTSLSTYTYTSTSSSTGTISGTVTAPGTYRVQVVVTQANNSYTVTIDDILISAGAYHYTGGNSCNIAPVVANETVTPVVTDIKQSTTVEVLKNDSDPNNPGSSITSPDKLAITSRTLANPAQGTLTINADSTTITFTPSNTFKGGTVTINYTVSDNGYAPLTSSGIATIVYPSPSPLQAVNDNYGSPENTTFSGNVITNPNGTDVTNGGAPFNSTVTATLVSGPVNSTGVAFDPTQYTFTFNADGSFTFTQKEGFPGGEVFFTYQISDNFYPTASNTATVRIAFADNTTLPVKLISFAGNAVNGKAKLSWKVADNETGSYFEIERSADARTFTSAARIENNKKPGEETYTFTDAAPLTRTTFYRLRMVNDDGSVAYSRYVPVHADGAAVKSIVLLKNPVYNNLELTFAADNAGVYTVNVYTAAGAKAYTTKTTLLKGSNNINLPLGGALNSGAYIVEVTNGATSVTTKFFKQ